jgi:hypothetical protein
VRLWIGAAALGALLGCGPREGSVALRLVRAPFDDPFHGANELLVRVLDPDLVVQRELSTPAAGAGRVELGLLTPDEQRLEVLATAEGRVRARGLSRLLAPAAEAALVELLPFASDRVAVALPAQSLVKPFAVDGALDEWSRASPSFVLDESTRVAGPTGSALDLRVEVMLAWAPERLLFAIVVSDDCPGLRVGEPAGGCGPAQQAERLALGFDAAADGGTVYNAGDQWIEVRATSVTVVRGDLAREDFPVVVVPARGGHGWIVEGALAARALGRSAFGEQDRIGLEVVVADHDPGQSEPTVLRFSGALLDPSGPTAPEAMGKLGLAAVAP